MFSAATYGYIAVCFSSSKLCLSWPLASVDIASTFADSVVKFAVDGFPKCEKWERRDMVDSKETKTSSWFNRFIGRAKKPEMTWPYPFLEGKMFVLTIQAGVEGYHINVGGRHVASFPHRMVNFPVPMTKILFGCIQWLMLYSSQMKTMTIGSQCLSGIHSRRCNWFSCNRWHRCSLGVCNLSSEGSS